MVRGKGLETGGTVLEAWHPLHSQTVRGKELETGGTDL